MNYVYLSPHFPPNYYQFCVHLHNLGAHVLGLADEPYDALNPALRAALSEYYRVGDMHNYDELLRALGHFTHRFGKLDRLDSLNEYWLESEAALRRDFNIFGLKPDDMPQIKRKSRMKQVYIKAGIPVARGAVVNTLTQAKKLIEETGYPLVAKPDSGVGAAATYKIHDLAELERFFEVKPPVDYIMEEFIRGQICTFDGLTDRDGNLVFMNSLVYNQGIMETVNEDSLVYYYTLRDIPTDLEDYGRRLLKAFEVRERFFHFEFFRTEEEGKLVGLEVNMRPPGGMTTDMFNFANDIDIYKEFAFVVVHNRFTAQATRPFHCAYVGRKMNRHYKYSHEEILRMFPGKIVHSEQVSGIFSAALGDFGYLARSPELAEIHEMAAAIHDNSLA